MIDHALYPVVLQHLHDTVQPALVIDKGRTGAGTGALVRQCPHDTVGALIDDSGRIISTAFAHTGLVCDQRAAHFFDQQRQFEVRENDRRACDQDARTVFFGCHLAALCFLLCFITQVMHILRPQRNVRIADCVHRRHVVRSLNGKRVSAPQFDEAGQLILRRSGHAARP